MKLMTKLAPAALAVSMTLGVASAAEITVVSWGGFDSNLGGYTRPETHGLYSNWHNAIELFGGAHTKSQVEAYHKPWAAATGNTYASEDYNGGLSEVKAQVEAGNVKWDLVDVELSDAVRGCDEGLLETLDISAMLAGDDGTAAADDFLPGTYTECAIGTIVWSTIYAYDSTKLDGKPSTIAEFFDLETQQASCVTVGGCVDDPWEDDNGQLSEAESEDEGGTICILSPNCGNRKQESDSQKNLGWPMMAREGIPVLGSGGPTIN